MSICKTGADHIQSLKDGRSIYIDGELVRDVTTHPAFAKSVASAAALYDYQAAPANLEAMTFELPGSNGRRVSRAWQMPHNLEETVARRKALQRWARQSYGFMGRSPDHLASALIGQKMGLELFEKDARPRQGLLRLRRLRHQERSFPHLRHHQPAGGTRQGLERAGRGSRRAHRR